MKTVLFSLHVLLAVVFLTRYSAAQGPQFDIKSGIIFNAESLYRSGLFKPVAKYTASVLWRVNPYMKMGPEVAIFNFPNENWIPAGIVVQSYFSQKVPLFLNTSLGYALSGRKGESGMDWGGIFLKSGVGFSVALSSKIDVLFDVQYYLQERKFRTFFTSFLDSEMQHLMEANAGIRVKL